MSTPFFRPLRPIRRRHLALMTQVAAIQHRVLDQSTTLGYLWSFLNPLLMLGVLFAFFGRQSGANVPHYAIYLLIGLVVFTHFSKSVAAGMRVLLRMRSLVTTVIFPKDVLVYSAILADLPEFLISLMLTVIIALASGVPATPALLALPLLIVAQVLLVLWIAISLAMMYVFVRDLDHLFEMAMRLLFFITPIVYRLDTLSPTLRQIALLNPVAVIIEDIRTVVVGGTVPPASHLGLLLTGHLALCYLALVLFRRAEPALLERL